MGWSDDDDWEADDVEKKLETKAATKAKDWDSSSDEEKKPAEEEKKPEPKAKGGFSAGAKTFTPKAKEAKEAEPKAEPKAKATGKKGKKKFTPMNFAADAEETQETVPDVPVADPVQEKKRKQKLVEDADARLADDLFADCPKPVKKETAKDESKSAAAGSSDLPPKVEYVTKDSFDELQLTLIKDVESLSTRCCKKINDSATLKAGAAHKFLFDLFKGLEPELSSQDLGELEKFVAEMLKHKKVSKTAVEANKKKGNEKMSKTAKHNIGDEMSIVYGTGGGEWDEEDWDGYEDY